MKDEKKDMVLVDMDNTAVNYTKQLKLYQARYPEYQYPQSVVGFFSDMEPMPGFLEAWKTLIQHYDMRFLSRASPYNLNSYTEKAVWVRDNMGGIDALEKLNLGPDKSIYEGEYLIDDWDVHGQKDFSGMHIHFGKDDRFLDWEMVTDYLMSKIVGRSNL